jgi:predicted ATP-dependent endonuclease of OLD family
MARIRLLQIQNFRSIQALIWAPSPGINCLIGPGDSGKSTILDAIDFTVGARRNLSFSDTDFHALEIATPVVISVTIGDLPSSLKEALNNSVFHVTEQA